MVLTFLKDLIRYTPSRIVPGIFGFLIIPFITRLLEPKDYGQYIIAISTIALVSVIASDWIGPSIIRFYALYQKEKQLNMFFGTILKISGISIISVLLMFYVILVLFKSYFQSSLFYYLCISSLLFVFGAFYGIMLHILIAMRKPNHYSLFVIWRQCICILIGITLIVLYGLKADGLILGSTIGIMIMIPILFKLTFKKLSIDYYSKKIKFDIMQYGFPLAATNLASWVISLSDRFIIQYFRSSHEVGLYSISYGIADRSINLLISIFILASAPFVMKLWETKGANETSLFITDSTKIFIIIILPVAVVLGLLSGPILKLLATKDFFEGHKIMPLVTASILIFGLQRNFQLGLLFYKKTNLIMYILLFSGMINIILNLFLVPKYGFLAAGYTTLFSYIIFGTLIIFFSRKYFKWRFPFVTLIKVIISTIIIGIIIAFIFQLNITSLILKFFLSIIVCGIVYILLLIVMNELNVEMFKKLLSSKTTSSN